MADKITAPDQELDEGDPITPGGEGAGTAPKIQSKTDEGEAEPDEGEAEPEIPVRRSAVQHIIARQGRVIDRLRSKANEDDDDFSPPKGADEDDEESLTPQAIGAVQREIAKAIGPVVKSLASSSDDNELSDLLGSDPEAQKYEKRIRAYMGHPQYRGVPPSVIYHHLAFDAAAGQGARRKGAANFEAGQGRGGGRTSRPDTDIGSDIPSADEQNAMSDADFEVLQSRALSGEFKREEE